MFEFFCWYLKFKSKLSTKENPSLGIVVQNATKFALQNYTKYLRLQYFGPTLWLVSMPGKYESDWCGIKQCLLPVNRQVGQQPNEGSCFTWALYICMKWCLYSPTTRHSLDCLAEICLKVGILLWLGKVENFLIFCSKRNVFSRLSVQMFSDQPSDF